MFQKLKIKHSKVLYEKFLENCTDPIASVRQGGACSLGYLVKANQEFLDPIIKDGINILLLRSKRKIISYRRKVYS